MLDVETKRRIDTARDILVGRIPDPKSQVEQITIALIYKFMDDLDAESEELGGKRKFFTGEFSRYGWAKGLMSHDLGGHETLNLYAEAISRIQENPGIPPLFRDIFKNAYLPYRDPETLRAFLKIINEFTYDHSERLGDAFEYLLSVLGSQGDAGQFRTPRHIIDFIVAILDPKKNETILDPACGTAGFLVSSYKHILLNNSDSLDNNTLTPEDKGRLAKNIRGYDISPDMVRLSLVNMYLHGFVDPHISEYDTLSNEDRWNEYADVIMANPPFMSPRGGVRPHKRFSIQAKRSEVLFVDYIAEHLTPSGRAGIVVPEGIVFHSQNAYKQLRKILVDEYLVAVISLPAGVFKPYSGVKTSILILDKSLARKTKNIAFFKVENDGFELGDKRLPINQSDLPQVQNEILEYMHLLRLEKPLKDFQPVLGLIVDKEKIAESNDYDLIGERYRKTELQKHREWPMVPIGKVCELIGGGTPSKQNRSYWTNGSVKWISSKHIDKRGQITGYELISQKAIEETTTKVVPRNSTIIITRVSVGKFAFADDEYAVNQDITALISKRTDQLNPEFLYVLAPNIARVVDRSAQGTGVRGVTRSFLSKQQIPLPPLEIQKEIVDEINGYQKIIKTAHSIITSYQPYIYIQPGWPMVPIGKVCELIGGGTPSKQNRSYWTNGSVKWISSKHIDKRGQITGYELISQKAIEETTTKVVPRNSTIIITRVSVGKFAFADDEYAVNQDITALISKRTDQLNPEFLYVLAPNIARVVDRSAQGTGVRGVTRSFLSKQQIPLPPLEIQKEIVDEIKAERTLVATNFELVKHFKKKIHITISRLWDKNEYIAAEE